MTFRHYVLAYILYSLSFISCAYDEMFLLTLQCRIDKDNKVITFPHPIQLNENGNWVFQTPTNLQVHITRDQNNQGYIDVESGTERATYTVNPENTLPLTTPSTTALSTPYGLIQATGITVPQPIYQPAPQQPYQSGYIPAVYPPEQQAIFVPPPTTDSTLQEHLIRIREAEKALQCSIDYNQLLSRQLNETRSESQQLKDKIGELVNKNAELEQEKQTVTDKLEQTSNQLTQEAESNAEIIKKNSKLQERLDLANSHTKNLESQLVQESSTSKELQQRLHQAYAHTSNLESFIAQQSLTSKEVHERLHKTDSQRKKLESQLSLQSSELKEALQRLTQTTSHSKELSEKLNQEAKKSEELEKQLTDNKKKYSTAQENIKLNNEGNMQLRAKLEERDIKINSLEDQCTSLQKYIDKQEQELKTFTNNLSSLKKEYEEAIRITTEQKKEINQIKKTLRNSNKKNNQLEKRIKAIGDVLSLPDKQQTSTYINEIIETTKKIEPIIKATDGSTKLITEIRTLISNIKIIIENDQFREQLKPAISMLTKACKERGLRLKKNHNLHPPATVDISATEVQYIAFYLQLSLLLPEIPCMDSALNILYLAFSIDFTQNNRYALLYSAILGNQKELEELFTPLQEPENKSSTNPLVLLNEALKKLILALFAHKHDLIKHTLSIINKNSSNFDKAIKSALEEEHYDDNRGLITKIMSYLIYISRFINDQEIKSNEINLWDKETPIVKYEILLNIHKLLTLYDLHHDSYILNEQSKLKKRFNKIYNTSLLKRKRKIPDSVLNKAKIAAQAATNKKPLSNNTTNESIKAAKDEINQNNKNLTSTDIENKSEKKEKRKKIKDYKNENIENRIITFINCDASILENTSDNQLEKIIKTIIEILNKGKPRNTITDLSESLLSDIDRKIEDFNKTVQLPKEFDELQLLKKLQPATQALKQKIKLIIALKKPLSEASLLNFVMKNTSDSIHQEYKFEILSVAILSEWDNFKPLVIKAITKNSDLKKPELKQLSSIFEALTYAFIALDIDTISKALEQIINDKVSISNYLTQLLKENPNNIKNDIWQLVHHYIYTTQSATNMIHTLLNDNLEQNALYKRASNTFTEINNFIHLFKNKIFDLINHINQPLNTEKRKTAYNKIRDILQELIEEWTVYSHHFIDNMNKLTLKIKKSSDSELTTSLQRSLIRQLHYLAGNFIVEEKPDLDPTGLLKRLNLLVHSIEDAGVFPAILQSSIVQPSTLTGGHSYNSVVQILHQLLAHCNSQDVTLQAIIQLAEKKRTEPAYQEYARSLLKEISAPQPVADDGSWGGLALFQQLNLLFQRPIFIIMTANPGTQNDKIAVLISGFDECITLSEQQLETYLEYQHHSTKQPLMIGHFHEAVRTGRNYWFSIISNSQSQSALANSRPETLLEEINFINSYLQYPLPSISESHRIYEELTNQINKKENPEITKPLITNFCRMILKYLRAALDKQKTTTREQKKQLTRLGCKTLILAYTIPELIENYSPLTFMPFILKSTSSDINHQLNTLKYLLKTEWTQLKKVLCSSFKFLSSDTPPEDDQTMILTTINQIIEIMFLSIIAEDKSLYQTTITTMQEYLTTFQLEHLSNNQNDQTDHKKQQRLKQRLLNTINFIRELHQNNHFFLNTELNTPSTSHSNPGDVLNLVDLFVNTVHQGLDDTASSSEIHKEVAVNRGHIKVGVVTDRHSFYEEANTSLFNASIRQLLNIRDIVTSEEILTLDPNNRLSNLGLVPQQAETSIFQAYIQISSETPTNLLDIINHFLQTAPEAFREIQIKFSENLVDYDDQRVAETLLQDIDTEILEDPNTWGGVAILRQLSEIAHRPIILILANQSYNSDGHYAMSIYLDNAPEYLSENELNEYLSYERSAVEYPLFLGFLQTDVRNYWFPLNLSTRDVTTQSGSNQEEHTEDRYALPAEPNLTQQSSYDNEPQSSDAINIPGTSSDSLPVRQHLLNNSTRTTTMRSPSLDFKPGTKVFDLMLKMIH